MKKATILGLSSTNKLIAVFDDAKICVEARFQGFQITNDITLRTYFDQLIGKEIECSYNKNQKTIRYQNESFFTNLLKAGALIVNPKELEELKIYTHEQKKNFTQISVSKESEVESKTQILLNDKEHSLILKKMIKEGKPIKAQIEYLSDTLLIRFENEGKIAFLKCKIENCKHYFQLFPQVQFWQEKFLPVQTEVKIVSQKYNLLEKTSQVFVTLSEQTLQHILKQGWVALNQKNYNKNPLQYFKKFSTAQNQSMQKNRGIYSSKSEILSFIYAKNNYVGMVTNIIEGYIFEIMSLKTKEVCKIELPMVICPVGQDAGSFWCKEFARKLLIGKEVNVYLHKESGLNITGNIVRIEDWKDVESVLLENGYAFVREEFKNSVLGQKYSVLELKAKQKQKGLHKKDIGSRRFEDLTQAPVSKAQIDSYIQRRFEVLNRLSENEEVVVQKIISSSTYKIRIESMSILLNIRLEGVIEPQLNPNLKEYSQIKQAAEQFLIKNFFQRTVIASISNYDEETNSFIGTLYVENGKSDLQEILIKNSYVYANKSNFISKYINLETEAKKEKKLIWQPRLLCFEPGFELDREQYCFEGRFSWLYNGKIAYVQPKDSFGTLQKLQQKIREENLPKLPNEKAKIGAWCAASYEGDLYRAIIKSRKDQNVTVQFFDWGNQEIVKVDTLKELPEEILYTQKQCIKVSLNLLGGTKNKEVVQKVRDMLFDGGVYVFKKVYGDSVDFFAGETSSVNEELICKGLLKADKDDLKRYENREMIKNVQEELRKERAGIWQESDSSDDETEEY